MPSRLPPLQGWDRRTAQESVTEALRHAVLGGVLPAGTRLVQADLAEEFGVSITPIREAIRQLSAEGLIELGSYRGAKVRTPTLDEVHEVYEMRLLLEPLALRKTVQRIQPDELSQARKIQEEMAGVEDAGSWVLLNRRFHGILIEAARSPRLASVIASLEDAATPQVALSAKADYRRITDGNDEHLHILQAIDAGDEDLVVELTSEHLKSTVRAIRTLLGGESGNATEDAQLPTAVEEN